MSPRRAQRQADRAQHRQQVAANTQVGFGRAQLRHSESTPDVPDKDKCVWLDIVREGKKATRFEVKCLECGSLGYVAKRKQAVDLCGTHLQEKHLGIPGRVRRDVT